MIIRSILIPAVLAAGLLVAFADSALAGPNTAGIGPRLGIAAHGGGFHGGGDVAIPVRGPYARGPNARRGGARRPGPYRPHQNGHWEVRAERVWIPGAVIGYCEHGDPIYGRGHWTVRHTRVWIPHRRPMARPLPRRGHVAVGVRF